MAGTLAGVGDAIGTGRGAEPGSDDVPDAPRARDSSQATGDATFVVVHPRDRDAQQAMAAYVAELDRRFPAGFEVADALAHDVEALAAPTGVFVVARVGGRAVGCGGLHRLAEGTGEIKRMWIDEGRRGVGLGRRMLAELESHARRLGYRRLLLDTNAVLVEAIALYRSEGYRRIDRYNENPYATEWFAKDLG
jgi:GNAT superfamily N-acetyltransferase